MTSRLVRQPLTIQNENSNVIPNKMMTGEKGKNAKLPLGKGGSSRKALGDITNKPNITKEVSTRKKIPVKEEFNILEERFLHDHKKCIEAQQLMSESMFLDIVLPGYGSTPSDSPVSDSSKLNHETLSDYPELVELPVPEIPDPLESALKPDWDLDLDSPPCSPNSWIWEEVEYFLKPENED
ncbi:protein PATRONUS 2 [Rutidosis leptorrhynchoides]|uniref:protein PATRONUS 2 n=1 Tax=Rutidosis leptorrhynchoides TaxID=125765 RepID=UPI003A9A21AC